MWIASMGCDRPVVNDVQDQATLDASSPVASSVATDMSMQDLGSQEQDLQRPPVEDMPKDASAEASVDMSAPKDPPQRGSRSRPRDPNAIDGYVVTCCDGPSSATMHMSGSASDTQGTLGTTSVLASSPPAVKSSVKLGEVAVVQGTCEVAAIKKNVARRTRAMQVCHERTLRSKPELSGHVKTSVIVSERGRAMTLETESNSAPSDELAACVKDTLKRIRYEVPQEGECHFTCEVTFSPASKK